MSLSREARALLRALRKGDGTIERVALGGWMTADLFHTEGHVVWSLVRAGVLEYTEWSTGRNRIGIKARLKPKQARGAA